MTPAHAGTTLQGQKISAEDEDDPRPRGDYVALFATDLKALG